MSKKNYNKISTEKVKAEVAEEIIDAESVVDEAASEVQVTIANPIGVVVDCKKLNVRAKPDAGSKIVSVIEKGSEVEIFMDASTDDFYSVTVSNITKRTRVDGYCMKKYISVKQ